MEGEAIFTVDSVSCDTVTLKYLVLLPYMRILVPHGAGATESFVTLVL
jgi:hypothetical protein